MPFEDLKPEAREGESDPQAEPEPVCGEIAEPLGSFAEFWDAYPKRVEKASARKAFEAVVKAGADPGAVIAGAIRYAVERAGQDPRYTKHPSTWLRAECWEDEPEGGAQVIDQDGHVVEPPARQSTARSILEFADELAASGILNWGSSS